LNAVVITTINETKTICHEHELYVCIVFGLTHLVFLGLMSEWWH